MLKSEDRARAMFENLSNNSRQQAFNKRRASTPKAPKTESLLEVGHSSNMATQVIDAITKKLDQLMTAGFAPNAAHISTQPELCSFCFSTMHQVNNYHTVGNYTDISNEQVNAAFSRPGTFRTPTLTTGGGEIIPISPGRVQMQKTQPPGSTIKLNLTGNPINRLQHTGLHSSNTRLPHRLLGQI
jgi:hypothetical protein